MKVSHIDHIVLTVRNLENTVQFYSEILGMDIIDYGDHRKALAFGNQKINLHEKGKEFEPKAHVPSCGSGDLCFVVTEKIESVKAELESHGIEIIEGIVQKTGAIGKMRSIYLRDPDLNLIELCSY